MSCTTPFVVARFWIDNAGLSQRCWVALSEPELQPAVELWAWALVFALTCALEAPFYLAALRRAPGGLFRKLLGWVLPNLATHPLVYVAIPWLVSRLEGRHIVTLTAGELLAPTVEALLVWRVWRVPPARAFATMFAANLFSWWLGVYLVT